MKIGILTFHRAINYGAVLQCYGLSETLKAMGHEVDVIDYRPECIEYYRKKIPFFKIRHTSGLRNQLKALIVSLLNIETVKDANRRFDLFLKNNFNLSKTVLSAENMPSDYDLIFLGSDQIWSPQICYGFDSIYWGQFKHDTTRLVTYAASLGGHNELSDLEWKNVGRYLKGFERISVREKKLQEDLENRVGIKSELVVDPTILVKETSFECLAKKPKEMPDNYVLVFSVAPTDNLYGFAEKVAAQTGSEIIVLTANKLWKCKYRNVTPTVEEFLGWFKYAKCIVTVSFHGTVFSVLFRKDFYSLTNYMQDRAEQLLKALGLESRLIESDTRTINNMSFTHIDYSSVNEKLDSLRESSISFIKQSLN